LTRQFRDLLRYRVEVWYRIRHHTIVSLALFQRGHAMNAIELLNQRRRILRACASGISGAADHSVDRRTLRGMNHGDESAKTEHGDTMTTHTAGIGVLFIAGFGPVVRDGVGSRKLYGDALGISFKEENGGYLHTEALKGANSFALWPLTEAAQSCYGEPSWPADVQVPQAWIEFDVADVEAATAELESQGYRMLVKNKKEPWGQHTSRFLGPEGLLVGVTFTPSMRIDD
jgi:hypothetical protein